jgi:hypothetical protein
MSDHVAEMFANRWPEHNDHGEVRLYDSLRGWVWMPRSSYDIGDHVIIENTDSPYNGCIAEVIVADKTGTLEQSSYPSYDVIVKMIDGSELLYKHLTEEYLRPVEEPS